MIHILLYAMITNLRVKKIDVIAQNSGKFIMFGFGNLQFKDSFSFLSSSLDRLVGLSKYKDYDDVRSGKIEWKIKNTWIIG